MASADAFVSLVSSIASSWATLSSNSLVALATYFVSIFVGLYLVILRLSMVRGESSIIIYTKSSLRSIKRAERGDMLLVGSVRIEWVRHMEKKFLNCV